MPKRFGDDGFYQSTGWRQLRLKALRRDGYTCRMCGAGIHGKGKAHVDHIESRRARPDLALSLSNVQCLCESCHNRTKQVQERNAHKPAVGLDGFPPGWG